MTVVADDTERSGTPGREAGVEASGPPASWPSRAAAFGIDVLVGTGVIAAQLLVAWSAAPRTWLWWVCVAGAGIVLLAMAVNRLLLPALTGWTLGRALLGIRVQRSVGRSVGPWRLLGRDATHLLDTAPVLLGWLWPLWDSRRRTFADMLTRTEVVRAQSPERARRLVGVAVTLAALVAVTAAALGYAVVYHHELAVERSREQIAVQGPKIVEDMLSYDPASLQRDFDRARSLVTDSYRDQLVTQQDAIRAGGDVVPNEYWVTNSAVLTAGPRDATMLLLLQGQRGTPPNQRGISATVRVGFTESDDGRWQVTDLSVLTKPRGGQ
ncbi:RDD family protein [Mycolicibacterium palauense]|uniref:RDD family protein n=1 Tax=Mycolicibacterium palauense TaxID=2034511 RepID=UPI000BFEE01F|nr:RDD family protein [Mycolicibacterium palauense]